MKAGFGKLAITPPIGTAMMGFGDRDRAHGCEGIHDDLFVRALSLSHADEEALILSFDLCFLGREEADRFKGAIGREIDLSPRQVLLNTSHNHVGPSVGRWAWADYTPPDQPYLRQLEKAVVEAACRAREAAREVTVWAGATRSRLPMNRRRKTDDGAVLLAPNPGGEVYDLLPLCLFKDVRGAPVCLLFSVSCHPVVTSGFMISAEYPGVTADRLDAYLGAQASMFLQGVGGDANPSVVGDSKEDWRTGTWEDVQKAGEMVSREVVQGIEDGLVQVDPGLCCAALETHWPLAPSMGRSGYEALLAEPDSSELLRQWAERQIATLKRAGQLSSDVPITVQGIQLGKGVRLVGIEGEPVSEFGVLIQAFYEEGVTFPLGCTNGAQLYLPTSEMLDEGGYEVESYYEYGYPAPLAPGMERILTQALKWLRAAGIG